MSVNAYIARGTNPGAGMLEAARAKRNAFVQDRDFQAQQDYRNASMQSQQERAEAEHERWVIGQVQSAQTEEQAKALYKWGREDAVRRGFDVTGSPEELPSGIWQPNNPAVGASEAFFNRLTENLTPDQKAQAGLIELGLSPRAVGNSDMTLAGRGPGVPSPESVGEAAGTVKAGERSGTNRADRLSKQIEVGLAGADGIVSAKRALGLLEGVSTGGIDAASLYAKQTFGIESGDEGELSNLLGKAVLSQLRETFGAQFTAAEGQQLMSIEAGFGKSPEANRRLLSNAIKIGVRAAERGIRAAESLGDYRAADEIRQALDFTLDSEGGGKPKTQIGRFTVEEEG